MTGLERGQLWVMRVHAAGLALFLLAAAAVAETVLREQFGLPHGTILVPLLVPIAYFLFIAPARRFGAWGYAVDADELQVRHGVWTQVHTVVPLDRVQHIDVSQGPVERAARVCRLVLHTAGTMHSQVVVPGLSRATAERIRDEIRARIREEDA